jgi:signal peptidase
MTAATHKRALRTLVRGAQAGLLVLSVAFLVGVGLAPRLGWYRPVTVLSGSMRPTFSPGDLIIVRPEALSAVRVGQVLSYEVPVGARQVETHRVIGVSHSGGAPVIRTQGDANNWPDPWSARLQGTTAWRLSVVVPYAGYAISAMRSRTVHLLSVLVFPGLLALFALARLWGVGPRRKVSDASA